MIQKSSFIICLLLSINLLAQKTSISQNELPKPAQEFISNHFGSQKISSVTQKVEHQTKTEYEVRFENLTEIEFDAKGNWKEVDGNRNIIPTGFISSEILNYTNQNFPKEKIIEIEKERSNFKVKLTNGLEIKFGSDGKFIATEPK